LFNNGIAADRNIGKEIDGFDGICTGLALDLEVYGVAFIYAEQAADGWFDPGGNHVGGKELDGEGGIEAVLWVIEVLYADLYLILNVVFEPAGEEIGFIGAEGDQAVLFYFHPDRRVFHKEEITAGIPVDLELITEAGIDMQGEIGIEVADAKGVIRFCGGVLQLQWGVKSRNLSERRVYIEYNYHKQ